MWEEHWGSRPSLASDPWVIPYVQLWGSCLNSGFCGFVNTLLCGYGLIKSLAMHDHFTLHPALAIPATHWRMRLKYESSHPDVDVLLSGLIMKPTTAPIQHTLAVHKRPSSFHRFWSFRNYMLGNWKETEHTSHNITADLERNITNWGKGSACEEIMKLLNVSVPNDSYSRYMQKENGCNNMERQANS